MEEGEARLWGNGTHVVNPSLVLRLPASLPPLHARLSNKNLAKYVAKEWREREKLRWKILLVVVARHATGAAGGNIAELKVEQGRRK